MPGVYCGFAAGWQLLLGLKASPVQDPARARAAAGKGSCDWGGVGEGEGMCRDTEGL